MTLYDQVIAPVASDLLTCLTEEMAKTPTPPDSICLRVGDHVDLLISQTYDECCAGLAWVRWAGQYPSSQGNFPSIDVSASPCEVTRWALVFELGAARCAPVAGVEGVPTCDAWLAAGVEHFADLAALRRAICCYANANSYQRVLVGEAEPQTTEGGCTSVTIRVTISASACDPVCREDS